MDCGICFEKVKKGEGVGCSEACDGYVCFECLGLLLNFSNQQGITPNCPVSKCKGKFFQRDFPLNTDPRELEKYSKICFDKLSGNFGKILLEAEITRCIVEKLRQDKLKYLENFPPSVMLVAKIALKKKLNSVDKNNLKKAEAICKRINVKCLEMFCNGKLMSDGSCAVCKKTFCLKCDAQVNGGKDGHYCNQDDIDSKLAVEKLVKCPDCKIPVIKSWGCDNMTCPVCKINFSYTTGERVKHGNHQDTTIVIKETFYEMVADKYPEKDLELLKEIEAKKPVLPKVHLFLKKYANDPEKALKYSAREYQAVCIASKKMEHYLKVLGYIVKAYEAGDVVPREGLLGLLRGL